MSKRLNSRNRQIKAGFLFASDAVLTVLKALSHGPFESECALDLYPFCFHTETKKRNKVKVCARDSWFRERDSTYVLAWEALEVSGEAVAALERDWERIKTALNALVGFVVEGKVTGRIEHPDYDLITLDDRNAHRLRAQRTAVYCSSFMQLKPRNSIEMPALVVFNQAELLEAVAPPKTTANDITAESEIQTKRGRNGETRPLFPSEKKRLVELSGQFIDLAEQTFPDGDVPRYPMRNLAMFFAAVAGLPTENRDGNSKNVGKGACRVAQVTIEEELANLQRVNSLLAKHGRPKKTEATKMFRFSEVLKNNEVFENYEQILLGRIRAEKQKRI